ncbi:MAG: asparagine synthase (glutamine-hydrolyzing) [Pseudomonadota bacterium]
MCGIAGLINSPFPAQQSPDIISNMLMMIGHRGPDGMGYLLEDHLAMGSVRLAILDPAAGIQPISDASGRYWLCYNGEVYNYRELRAELETADYVFQTHCDTEVLLAAWLTWGDACLSRFNGCFAFALYDRQEKHLVLARDRFGKRPLFYAEHRGALLFASEMKAFLAVPGYRFEQDPQQLASILGQWTPLPDQTGFTGISSLPMGQWLSYRDGQIRLHDYYRLRFDQGPTVASEDEAMEMIRTSLHDSVSLRLRSDVEVGVYLSGGVDSAIVAALAKNISDQPLSTFSVEFEDTEFDESGEQKLVARHLDTRHHATHITYQDVVTACPEAVLHAEVPAFRSAFIPMFLLSRQTRAQGIKVILSGEGADEAFLGYDLFKETLLRHAWNEIPDHLRSDRLRRFYPHLAHYGPGDIAAMTGLYQQFSTEQIPGLFSHEMRLQNGLFATRLLAGKHTPFTAISNLIAAHPEYAAMSPVQKAQWLEYKTLLPGYLLSTQGERMGLAHGVENRCPFLDPSVIELASAINLKFDDGYTEKRLLRQAFRADIPKAVVEKRKFPYRAPDVAAFSAVRPDYLELVLSQDELGKLPFLNAKFAQKLSNKVLNRPASDISTKENQAFLFLLSMMLIHRYFVSRESSISVSTSVQPPLQRVVDLRTR